MSNTKKPEDQNTAASATELDESALDSIEGGATEVLKGDWGDSKELRYSETGDGKWGGSKNSELRKGSEKLGFATEEIKREG